MVDPAPIFVLHSAETVGENSDSAEEVDMDTTPLLLPTMELGAEMPPSTPATSSLASDNKEAAVRPHACKERDARQSLALSDNDSTQDIASPPAMPAETMLGCDDVKAQFPEILISAFQQPGNDRTA